MTLAIGQIRQLDFSLYKTPSAGLKKNLLNTLLTSQNNKGNHQSSSIVTIQNVLSVLASVVSKEKQKF